MSKKQQDLEIDKLSEALLDPKTLKKSRKSSKKPKSSKLHKTSTSDIIIPSPIPAPFALSADAELIDFDADQIMSYQELISALSARVNQITLGNNIIAEDNILINCDVTIDFNGYSIISEESYSAARVLDIRSGNVNLTGHGKVFAMGAHSVAIRVFGAISSGVPNYTTLTVGEDINLFAPDSYGILVSPNLGVAYGLTVNFSGKIFAHDGICIASGIRGYDQNLPQINIKPDSAITADEQSGSAVEASGYGIWDITSARLRGAAGVSGVAGIIKLSHPQIHTSVAPDFYLVDSPDALLDITTDGGIYISENAPNIDGYKTSIKKFAIKGGDFCSPLGPVAANLEDSINLKSATLHDDVTKFLSSLVAEPEPEEETPAPSPTTSSESPLGNPKQETIDFEETDLARAPSLIESLAMTSLSPSPIPSRTSSRTSNPPSSHTSSRPLPASATASPSTMATLPFSERLNMIPELTDAETDEAEIVSELTAGKHKKKSHRSQNKKTPSSPIPKPPAPQVDFSPTVPPAPSVSIPTPGAIAAPVNRTSSSTISTSATEVIPTPSFQDILADPADAEPASFVPTPPVDDEQSSARTALSEALSEIRKLRREDYVEGFSRLETAIRESEDILADPASSIAEICNAAGNLLQAFDALEERNELSLTDDELDELFYHGAILEEMANHSTKPKRAKPAKASPSPLPESIPSSGNFQHLHLTLKPPVKPIAPPPEPPLPEPNPDFSVLSELLTTISELNLQAYSPASRTALLNTLDRAHSVLVDINSTQGAIDEVTTSLLAEFSRLEPQRIPRSLSSPVKLSSPAPIVGRVLPPTMIDEMTPASIWSQGVTMIDEMTPFITDVDTREKMLRSMQPIFVATTEAIARPFKRLARSFAAGTRAGLSAYREALHAK